MAKRKNKLWKFNIYPLKPRLLLIFGDAVAAAEFSVDNVKSEMGKLRNEISIKRGLNVHSAECAMLCCVCICDKVVARPIIYLLIGSNLAGTAHLFYQPVYQYGKATAAADKTNFS